MKKASIIIAIMLLLAGGVFGATRYFNSDSNTNSAKEVKEPNKSVVNKEKKIEKVKKSEEKSKEKTSESIKKEAAGTNSASNNVRNESANNSVKSTRYIAPAATTAVKSAPATAVPKKAEAKPELSKEVLKPVMETPLVPTKPDEEPAPVIPSQPKVEDEDLIFNMATTPSASSLKDGWFFGFSYGRLLDKMELFINIKDGKIAELRNEMYSDTLRTKEKRLDKSNFFSKFSQADPQTAKKAIWMKMEYLELIEEAGDGNRSKKAKELIGDYANEIAEELDAGKGDDPYSVPQIKKFKKVINKYIKDKVWKDIDSTTGATFSSYNYANAVIEAMNKSEEIAKVNPTTAREEYMPVKDEEFNSEEVKITDLKASSTLSKKHGIVELVISKELKAKFRNDLIADDFSVLGDQGNTQVKGLKFEDSGKKIILYLESKEGISKDKKETYLEVISNAVLFDRKTEERLKSIKLPLVATGSRDTKNIEIEGGTALKDFPVKFPYGNYIKDEENIKKHRTSALAVSQGEEISLTLYPLDQEKEEVRKEFGEFLNSLNKVTIDSKPIEFEIYDNQNNYQAMIKLKIGKDILNGEDYKVTNIGLFAKGYMPFVNQDIIVFKESRGYFEAKDLTINSTLKWNDKKELTGSLKATIDKKHNGFFNRDLIEKQLKEEHTSLYLIKELPDGVLVDNIILSDDDRTIEITFKGAATGDIDKSTEAKFELDFRGVRGYFTTPKTDYFGDSEEAYLVILGKIEK